MNIPGDELPDAERQAAVALAMAQVALANGDREHARRLLGDVLDLDVAEPAARALVELAHAGDGEEALDHLREAEHRARGLLSCELLLDVSAGYLRMGHPVCSK